MKTTLETPALGDVQLVERCRSGDREAFARIVERYQSLICALTYGGCGRLQASEDLAQVTFITAWRELPKLQEPAKLKAWLCGIARNVLHNSFRQHRRAPTAHAEPLDETRELAADVPSPRDHAITREEEAILWRTLQEMPATYREPLVLFYRQQQSAADVAETLGLSEEAVHQRLSRGRAMLTERVADLVETTLRHSNPGPAFTLQVVAALPAALGTAASVSAGAAAPGAVGTKAGLLGLLAPLVGVAGGMVAHGLIIRRVATPQERRGLLVCVLSCWAFALGWGWLGQIGVSALSRREQWSEATFYRVMAGFWCFFAVVIATIVVVMFRGMFAARQRAEKECPAVGAPKQLSLTTRIMIVTGMYLAWFWGLIFAAWEAHDRLGAGIIATVMVVLGVAYFFHLRNKAGVAGLRAAIGHVVIAFCTMLLVLNVRIDVWLAGIRGAAVGEVHQLLPMSIVRALTLGLCLWIVALCALTQPRANSHPAGK